MSSTFASSRILYPLVNWPFLAVGLEKVVDLTHSSITMGLTEFRIAEIRWGREPTFAPTGFWSCGRLVYSWSALTRMPFWPGLEQPRMARLLITTFSYGSSLSLSLPNSP